jgi:uncharacterized protein YggT (Ycf19 family)
MPIELLSISVLRTLVEVAMFCLLGQGVVGLLSGAARASNPIYQVFSIVSRPPVQVIRFLMPRLVVDKHVPLVTFFVLFWLWIVLAYAKRSLCQMSGLVF